MAQYNGVFVNPTQVWDVAQLKDLDVKSPEFKELLVRMYQNINNIAMATNLKDTGTYYTQETVNGQTFFPNPANSSATAQTAAPRQVIRKVINFQALPNAGLKSVAHGITCNTGVTFTRIYGTSTKPTAAFSYIPIPYATGVAANIIELYVDATNVNIVTAANYSAWTVTYVVLEYLIN